MSTSAPGGWRPARMRIAITLGDPNGIGPEIAIKAAQHFARDPKIKPLLVGDGFVIEDTASRLGARCHAALRRRRSARPGRLRARHARPARRQGDRRLCRDRGAPRARGQGRRDHRLPALGDRGEPRRHSLQRLSRPGRRPHRHAARPRLHDADGQGPADRARDPARSGERRPRPPHARTGHRRRRGDRGDRAAPRREASDHRRVRHQPACRRGRTVRRRRRTRHQAGRRRTEEARHRRRRPGRRRPAAEPAQARRLSRHVPRPGPHPDQADLAAARLGHDRSACRCCSRASPTAAPSTSRARASPIRPA